MRIRVLAATVNPADILFRQGGVAQALARATPPYVAGLELAGTVDAVGAGVRWPPGDQVAAITHFVPEGRGAHAEAVVTSAASVMSIPPNLSVVEAATIPMNGLTARLALDTLDLGAGATLAITGAVGALGGYVAELAKSDGISHVVGIVDPADAGLARTLGCDVVVPRGPGAAAEIRDVVTGGVDGLIDAAMIGREMLWAVTDGGGFVAVRRPAPASERDIRVTAISVPDYEHNSAALEALGGLAAAGTLTPRVAEIFALERAAQAHRLLERGGVRGRLVLDFS